MIKSLKYSAIATMLAFSGCSCTIRGPITGTNYSLDTYETGVKIQSDFIQLKIGSQK